MEQDPTARPMLDPEMQRYLMQRKVRSQIGQLRTRQKMMSRNARTLGGGGRHAPGETKPDLDDRVAKRREAAKRAKASRRRNR